MEEQLIIETGNAVHPQARITAANFDVGRVDFVWVGGPDTMDHSVFCAVSPSTLVADCTAAVLSVLPPLE